MVLSTFSGFFFLFFFTNSEIGEVLTCALPNTRKHTDTFNTHLTKMHLCADAIHLVKCHPQHLNYLFASPRGPCSQLFLLLFLHCFFFLRPLLLSPLPSRSLFLSFLLSLCGRYRQAGLTGPLTDKEEMVAL